jgi:hypothetical protein
MYNNRERIKRGSGRTLPQEGKQLNIRILRGIGLSVFTFAYYKTKDVDRKGRNKE